MVIILFNLSTNILPKSKFEHQEAMRVYSNVSVINGIDFYN